MSTLDQGIVLDTYARAAAGRDRSTLDELLRSLQSAGVVDRALLVRASGELTDLRNSGNLATAERLGRVMIGAAGIRDDLAEQAAFLNWPKADDGKIARAYRDVVDGYDITTTDLAQLSPDARRQFDRHVEEIRQELRDGGGDRTRAERIAIVRANELVGTDGAVIEPEPEPMSTDPRELADLITSRSGLMR